MTRAKSGIPALSWASHSGKLDTPVLQGPSLDAWEVWGAFNSMSRLSSENLGLTGLAHPQSL